MRELRNAWKRTAEKGVKVGVAVKGCVSVVKDADDGAMSSKDVSSSPLFCVESLTLQGLHVLFQPTPIAKRPAIRDVLIGKEVWRD